MFMRVGFLSIQGLFGWAGRVSVRKPTDVKSMYAEAYGTNHANPVVLQLEGERTEYVENTRRFNQILESYIRRYPDQWLWIHRRWTRRPRPTAW